MSSESQAQNPVDAGLASIERSNGGFQSKPVGRRGGQRVKIKDLQFCKAVITLAMEGFTARGIAKQLKTSMDTIRYILNAARIDELRKLVVAKMAHDIVNVRDMVFDETLDKKDRRLGHEMLRESGMYDGLRDKAAAQSSQGITIEFNFPPPPWAPKPILDAGKAKAIDVERANEQAKDTIEDSSHS